MSKVIEIYRMYMYLSEHKVKLFDSDWYNDGNVKLSWGHHSLIFKSATAAVSLKSVNDFDLSINLKDGTAKWIKGQYYSKYSSDDGNIEKEVPFSAIEDSLYEYLFKWMKDLAEKKAIETITQKEMKKVLNGHYEALKLLK